MKNWRELNKSLVQETSIAALTEMLVDPDFLGKPNRQTFPRRIHSRLKRVRDHKEDFLIATQDAELIKKWAKLSKQMEAIFNDAEARYR